MIKLLSKSSSVSKFLFLKEVSVSFSPLNAIYWFIKYSAESMIPIKTLFLFLSSSFMIYIGIARVN